MLGCNESLFKRKDFSMRTNTLAEQQATHAIFNFQLCSVIVLAAFAMGAASLTHAQGATPSAGGAVPANKVTSQDLDAAFNRADADRDGKLSRAEAEHFPAVAQRFEQIDGNRDSFISREEFYKAATS